MVASEVQRTLVKSPPELWAELSDPAALARHLGALGEIRITRTEAERTVEWEGENVTGSVSIQPSGWGTKVTLKVSREVPDVVPPPADETEPEQTADAEERLEVQPEGTDQPEAEATSEPELAPEATHEHKPTHEAEAGHEPEADSESSLDMPAEPRAPADDPIAPVPEPRRGFFARLFRRRARTAPQPNAKLDPPNAFAAVSEALAPATFAETDAFAVTQAAAPTPAPLVPLAPPPSASQPESLPPTPEPLAELQPAQEQAEHRDDISAELMAAEEVAAEEVTAVLTAVLDRLGAAHHRPFSRA